MGWILGKGIGIPFRTGGKESWSTYWTSLISATVENAAPTNVVLTFPSAKPSLGASDFTIAGFTISSASWAGAVLTLVLSTSVVYGDSLTVTFVTTGGTHAVTNNVALDTNAAAFLTATGITDETQKTAVNKFVIEVKAINNVSASFVDFATPANGVLRAVYPFVGGTATTHKYNIIDPRDEDAAFRLDFNGTMTHDATGIKPDGSTAYADTHLVTTTHLTQHSVSLAYYSLENTTDDGFDIGNYLNATTGSALSLKFTALGGATSYLNGPATKCAVATDTRGLFLSNRISNVRHDLYRNHEIINSNTTANTDNLLNQTNYLFAIYYAGNPTNFVDRKCCYAHITKGIPDVAIQLYIKAVQNLQTNLGRGDMYVPAMATTGSPAAGARVKAQIAGWNAAIYHSLYLPTNYSTDRTWPIIIDAPGNVVTWRNGLPNQHHLGYGLSEGADFIWVVVPFINAGKTAMAPTWWGDGSDPATQSIDSTTDYWDDVIADIVANYHGDASKIILMGFSRGAIACGYIGCHDDAYAAKFISWMPHSHHDGGTFTPVGADTRLARMLGKKTCITYGGTALDAGYANSQTGLGLVQAAGVTESHYQITDMAHDIEHSLRNDDATVDSIRAFLAQYK